MKSYIVDAFTDTLFKGNPAAVCVLDEWLSDSLMQNIAKENNLSETAFVVPNGNHYKLKWFTPGGEIDLCGHATLATAFVITRFVDTTLLKVIFETKSGILTVYKKDNLFEMDLPAYKMQSVKVTDEMEAAIGYRPKEAWIGRDLVCILESEEEVFNAKPNLEKVKKLDGLTLNITAKGSDYDCVTRSFAPKLNVSEDPVCGSCHCHVIPIWSKATGKKSFVAFQASERTGVLYCEMDGNRVKISGEAILYSISEIFLSKSM